MKNIMVVLGLALALATTAAHAGKKHYQPPQPQPDRLIWLGDHPDHGLQFFPFSSMNSLWCRTSTGQIEISHMRISDRQLFTTVVDANPVDFRASCFAWAEYLNGTGPRPDNQGPIPQ